MEHIPFWSSIGGLRLATESFRSPRQTPLWHSHPFFEFALVFSGACDWETGVRPGERARLTVEAGEVLLLPPEVEHRELIRPGGEAGICWIGFESSAPPPNWSGQAIGLGGDGDEVARLCHIIYREHSRPEHAARVRLALQMLLLLVSRQSERPAVPKPGRSRSGSGLNARQVRCIEAAAYTLRHNLNPPMEISQVATYHSLSHAHFSTLFRRHFQVSPRHFVQQARVEKAAELLSRSDLTIKEIAVESGFADSAHFCKVFRAVKNVSPGNYRERLKKARPC